MERTSFAARKSIECHSKSVVHWTNQLETFSGAGHTWQLPRKSDGHLVDNLHEMLFSVAQWSAEEQTLEIDGKEVAKATHGHRKELQ